MMNSDIDKIYMYSMDREFNSTPFGRLQILNLSVVSVIIG